MSGPRGRALSDSEGRSQLSRAQREALERQRRPATPEREERKAQMAANVEAAEAAAEAGESPANVTPIAPPEQGSIEQMLAGLVPSSGGFEARLQDRRAELVKDLQAVDAMITWVKQNPAVAPMLEDMIEAFKHD